MSSAVQAASADAGCVKSASTNRYLNCFGSERGNL